MHTTSIHVCGDTYITYIHMRIHMCACTILFLADTFCCLNPGKIVTAEEVPPFFALLSMTLKLSRRKMLRRGG